MEHLEHLVISDMSPYFGTLLIAMLTCLPSNIYHCSEERILAPNLQVKLYQQCNNTKYVVAYNKKSPPTELVFKPPRSAD